MSWSDHISRLFARSQPTASAEVQPSKPWPRPQQRRSARMDAYEATSSKPRVADWEQSVYGPNTVTENASTARARSQDAIRNNPWMRKAVRLLVSHLIGCGIQPRPKIADKGLRNEILGLWNDWTDQADADGVCGFYALQSLMSRSRYESGEVFARLVWRNRNDSNAPIVPLQLRILEADLVPTGYNRPDQNIRQGIERGATGQRIAYHFYKQHPGDRLFQPNAGNIQRIPAAEILHHYLPDRPGQLRGMPEGISALYRARTLDRYESAELARKHNKSKFSGAIWKEQPEDNPISDVPANPVLADLQKQLTAIESSADYANNVAEALAAADALREQIIIEQEKKTFIDIEEGYMLQLGMNERIELFNGDTGNAGLLDFLRSQLRGIAAGWHVPYELLTGDYADTNDRVMRVILNVFYRELESQQDHYISQVLQPFYRWWIAAAVYSNTIRIPGFRDNPRMYSRCEWRTHAWSYVNQLQEVQTKILKIRNGLASRSGIVAEDGWDAEDIDQQNKDDQDREQRLGLDYGGDVATAPDTVEKP